VFDTGLMTIRAYFNVRLVREPIHHSFKKEKTSLIQMLIVEENYFKQKIA